jgi:non-heme chloroperoxidase
MERKLTLQPTPLGRVQPVATHEIRGGGGVRLHAREWGNPSGRAILFIHGWSQCDACWTKQVSGALADRFRMVTVDIRGHGLSEKPAEAEHYGDGRVWADDVAAVIDQTDLERPLLVAWSYGGYIVTDYVRAYGDAAIAGIDLVAAAVIMTPAFDHVGSGLLDNADDMCSPDVLANIAATRRFLVRCTAQPLDDNAAAAMLGWNMVVPPAVRGALFAREIDGSDALASLTVPVLVSHGREDAIVLPSMSEHVLERCPTAEASWYDGIGHMPFWEAPERFDRELAELADRVDSSLSGGWPTPASRPQKSPARTLVRGSGRT